MGKHGSYCVSLQTYFTHSLLYSFSSSCKGQKDFPTSNLSLCYSLHLEWSSSEYSHKVCSFSSFCFCLNITFSESPSQSFYLVVGHLYSHSHLFISFIHGKCHNCMVIFIHLLLYLFLLLLFCLPSPLDYNLHKGRDHILHIYSWIFSY